MAHDWLQLQRVLDHLGVAAGSPQAQTADAARTAAAALVERLRPDLWVVPDLMTPPTFVADDAVIAGAVLVAARLHARRGSPVGLATFGEAGAASLPRLDPDAERLLGVGRYAPPQVG